jgi:hypothetical protein
VRNNSLAKLDVWDFVGYREGWTVGDPVLLDHDDSRHGETMLMKRKTRWASLRCGEALLRCERQRSERTSLSEI